MVDFKGHRIYYYRKMYFYTKMYFYRMHGWLRMKIVDGIVLTLFVIGLIVLCFFQQCSLDIYFLVFGFAVAIMCGITLFRLDKKKNLNTDDESSNY